MVKKLLIAAALLASATSANALDNKERALARATTQVVALTLWCPEFSPRKDVLVFLGEKSVGAERSKQIFLAVGSEVTKMLRAGGMKLGKGGDPANLIPEISEVVDDDMREFLALKTEVVCRDLGDLMIKEGFADPRP